MRLSMVLVLSVLPFHQWFDISGRDLVLLNDLIERMTYNWILRSILSGHCMNELFPVYTVNYHVLYALFGLFGHCSGILQRIYKCIWPSWEQKAQQPWHRLQHGRRQTYPTDPSPTYMHHTTKPHPPNGTYLTLFRILERTRWSSWDRQTSDHIQGGITMMTRHHN